MQNLAVSCGTNSTSKLYQKMLRAVHVHVNCTYTHVKIADSTKYANICYLLLCTKPIVTVTFDCIAFCMIHYSMYVSLGDVDYP